MNVDSIAVHRPRGKPQHAILLYHGFGSTAKDMIPVGIRLSFAYPRALIASIGAPHAAEIGAGLQWFSLKGISEENRMQRVAAEMENFVRSVREWKARAGVDAERTVLAGFSQGATMMLEAVKASPGLASRAVSFGGRFAALPTRRLHHTRLHLLHGEADPVVHCHHSITAAERLLSLGSAVTLDIRPRAGYAIDDGMINTALERLLSFAEPTQGHGRAGRGIARHHYDAR